MEISVVAIFLAVIMGFVAPGLTGLIGLITNLLYHQRWSFELSAPGLHHLGPIAILFPALGGVIVGLMARYGSTAIRGHGIPEAMEQVLFRESRIPARMTWLKPLSAAISIGTGGPFGAEGPIIATGGALGSLLGQLLPVSPDERKTLLVAGAAAGMSATFGAPVASVLLGIELLLFELKPDSLLPVALASCVATGVRYAVVGTEPIFPMPEVQAPGMAALAIYVAIGAGIGVLAIFATRIIFWIEDAFAKLPVHWMWWPAIGGLVVGVVGHISPLTLGVGYANIEAIVSGRFVGSAMIIFCFWKLVSWSVALGSGTSGGTLAPLFTIGGGAGSLLGMGVAVLLPQAGVDLRIAALVGMAAIFAGASRTLLMSVVFAYETTRQPFGLLPLLGGCAASFLVAQWGMATSIMTETLVRRGRPISTDQSVDPLAFEIVADHCSNVPATLNTSQSITQALAGIGAFEPAQRHQSYPVLDAEGWVVGVVTVRELLEADGATSVGSLLRRPLVSVFSDESMRTVADRMVEEGVGRLPVVERSRPQVMVGFVTRGDILNVYTRRLSPPRAKGPRLRKIA